MKSKLRAWAVAAILMAAAAAPVQAITFFDSKLADPFKAGQKCTTNEIGSMGSYVYDYPSKYDGVYSPWIDGPFIWTCPASGFVTFGSEFNDIPADQKAKIAAWLEANPADIKTLGEEQLHDRMEAIYAARGMPDDFWAYFYRVRAHYAHTAEKGDAYRAKALPLLKARLNDAKVAPADRAQALFLVGYYSRRLGDPSGAAKAFAAIGDIDWSKARENRKGTAEYFGELIKDVQAGKLDGQCGQVNDAPSSCPLARQGAAETAH